MKSNRNKTLDMGVEEGKKFLDRCLFLSTKSCVSKITNKTICGDTLKTLDLLPDKFIDLLIADPPYNMNKDFNGTKFKNMSEDSYEQYTDIWINAIKPKLKDNASIYVCCDWLSSSAIYNVLKENFYIQNRITWQREKGRGSKNNWKNSMEDVWFATNGKTYYFDVDNVLMRRKVIAPYRVDGRPKDWEDTPYGKFRNTYPSNFWDDLSVPYWSMKENTAHPTQKPEKLIAKLVLASSKEGDFVFDPFLGSGTTSVVSKKLNRRYCGIERNEQYCVWAEKRLDDANKNRQIQGYSDGVFWERNTSSMQAKFNNLKVS